MQVDNCNNPVLQNCPYVNSLAVFTPPSLLSVGNATRVLDNIRMPHVVTYNMAFLKDFPIHEKVRLAIMSLLAASPQLSFTEMRDTLNMTDGNLTAHVRTLQEAGYVSVTKEFQGRRPLTTYSLTARGRKAFATYINLLEQIVQQTKPAK